MKNVLLGLVGMAGLLASVPSGHGQAVKTGQPAKAATYLPMQVFAPAKNPYAKRLVSEPFQVVDHLDGIDRKVLDVFYEKVPRLDMADRGGRFNPVDVDDGDHAPGRRLMFAGKAAGIWFVLYEHGGRGYHQNLMVIARESDGSPWRLVALLSGLVQKGASPEDLKAAIKAGRLEEQPGYVHD